MCEFCNAGASPFIYIVKESGAVCERLLVTKGPQLGK